MSEYGFLSIDEVQRALSEGASPHVVLNINHGSAEHEEARQDKLNRERLLLLADMTADFRDDPFSAGGAAPECPVSDKERDA